MTVNAHTALLGYVNDQTAIRPYGEGVLVDLPLTYSDGDVVRVHVEPVSSGYRVSDRAEAVDRLEQYGVNAWTGRAATAIATTKLEANLNAINSAEQEIATFGDEAQVGAMIMAVAQTAVRVEQLRWLASPRSRPYRERLYDRLHDASTRRWKIERNPTVRLQSGRIRPVTLSVQGERGTAWVQALSKSDQDSSVSHCYYLFDRSNIPKDSRVAALDGRKEDWPAGVADDLAVVGAVEFFDEPLELERELERIAGKVMSVQL